MNKDIPIFRHFEDVDDLEKEGRDGSLIEGQEDTALKLAHEIYNDYLTPDCKALFIITSSKKRSIQTAELVSLELKRIEPDLKIRTVSESALREIDQGRVLLPPDYIAGEKFEGLQLAGKVFFEETFGGDFDNGSDNFSYRYSDPLMMNDGNYKYPELAKFFSEPGESYKEVLIRLYEVLIDFSEHIERFDSTIKFVICTHTMIIRLLEDLIEASELIEKSELIVEPGTLPRVCWELFKKRAKVKLVIGDFRSISIEPLLNENLIQLLRQEVEFLKHN